MQMVDELPVSCCEKSSLLPWLVCLSASLIFFYEFVQGNMFASIADGIMSDFNIQADKMAWLSSFYYFSNVLFLFIAGMLLDKFSARRTILLAMALCVVSTFILANAHSFWLALTCRFMAGIGSAFCFLGPVRIASRWFPARRMALVTGVIVTMAMSGGMLAQYPLTRLVAHVGWRDAVVQVGWMGVAMLLVMYFAVYEKATTSAQSPHENHENPIAETIKTFANRQYLRASLYTSLMNMAIAVFGAMMGTLYVMQRLGVSKEEAAMVNSMLFLGAIIGGPLLGWISDRLALRVLPMKIGAVLSLLVMLAILLAPVSLAGMKGLFFLLGLFTSAQVISYALVAESSPSHLTATALSVISVLTQGGYIVYQNLFGLLLVNHGGMHLENNVPVYTLSAYQFAGMVLPFGLLLALCVLFGLKETYGRHIEEPA